MRAPDKYCKRRAADLHSARARLQRHLLHLTAQGVPSGLDRFLWPGERLSRPQDLSLHRLARLVFVLEHLAEQPLPALRLEPLIKAEDALRHPGFEGVESEASAEAKQIADSAQLGGGSHV